MNVSERKVEAAECACGRAPDAGHGPNAGEDRFRTMADGLPLIVWVHGPSGEQQFVNATFCEFFGVTHEEMRGGRWRLLMHPEDAGSYEAEFMACVADHRPFHARVRVRRADGQWRWIESWARPRFSRGGEFQGFVGTSADITEQVQAEEVLRRHNRELERFAAVVGHDLREPVRGMAMLAGFVLSDEPGIGGESAARLRRIQELSAQLGEMIAGLLDYARSGGARRSEPCDLGEVAQRAADGLSEMLRARGVDVLIGAGLPMITGDPVLLERIFANLIANAAKHGDTPRTTVRISVGEDGAVWVSDDGPGVAPEERERVFELFTRGGRSDWDGLGLAIVRQIVESHGGTIRLRCEGERGASFVMQFPGAVFGGPMV